MSYLEQSRQNAAARRDAAELGKMRRDAELAEVADFAQSEGANLGYQQGVQEGSQAVMAGIKQELMNLFGQRPQEPIQEQGLADSYNLEAQDLRRQMEQDAQQEAFMRAKSMRDTSEGNLNILINEELKRRGL